MSNQRVLEALNCDTFYCTYNYSQRSMTNPLPLGSDGASPMYAASNSGLTPRRTSYASVAAGTTSNNPLGHPVPARQEFARMVSLGSLGDSRQSISRNISRMSFPQSGQDGLAGGPGVDNTEALGRAGGTTNHTSHHYYGHGRHWPTYPISEPHGFFTPTYLNGSVYMERLEAAHKAKISARRDAHSAHSSHPGSLSTSSSSASLHKLAPSHRGMTYEIIERIPPSEDDGVSPLPSKWGEVDKHGGLEITADGMEVKYVGLTKLHEHEAVAARADQPMPPECGLYYFEVTIISKGKEGSVVSLGKRKHC